MTQECPEKLAALMAWMGDWWTNSPCPEMGHKVPAKLLADGQHSRILDYFSTYFASRVGRTYEKETNYPSVRGESVQWVGQDLMPSLEESRAALEELTGSNW